MRDLLAFPDSSRVWIYQGDKPLPADDIGLVNDQIESFAKEWVSHNIQLSATGGLLHDMFLILVADESRTGASGCSIDPSVRFVRQMGEAYQTDFFNRLYFTYLADEKVHRVHRDGIAELYGQGKINDDTLFFDNLVADKKQFLERWVTPFGKSWIKRFAS
jgi:hypothetical protein